MSTTAAYKEIEGIKCFAPDLAFGNTGFQEKSFDLLFQIESEHFWYRSRNRMIKDIFSKYIGDRNANVLEIGCGTGYVLSGLTGFSSYRLTGAEIYLHGLRYARKRLPGVDFIQMDAADMPFENEFDAVGAFDVLEHIEEDERVMRNAFKALKTGGYFFVTVPQYQFMWSSSDVVDCHKRRYSRKDLRAKLARADFDIKYIGSFVFTLFPLMLAERLVKKKNEQASIEEGYSDLMLPRIVNRILNKLMWIDEMLIRGGISLPFGGSVIAVAQKK